MGAGMCDAGSTGVFAAICQRGVVQVFRQSRTTGRLLCASCRVEWSCLSVQC